MQQLSGMKIKMKCLVLCSVLFVSVLADAQTRNKNYLSYIEQYHQLAERQQKEHGIPSSISLAQGLLESGAGLSTLAQASNNHFGIKCSDWTGDKVYYDDDTKGECFRKYSLVLDSYEDHAAFLRGRSRYASLFLLNPTDYEAWAHGLKKAGYATDPTYAFKLISIIEGYDLHRFDLGISTGRASNGEGQLSGKKNDKSVSSNSMGSIDAYLSHAVLKNNGVRYITALAADTYGSVADEFNVSEERIRRYNDVSSTTGLNPGTRVYIYPKKRHASKEFSSHTIMQGETMYSISQHYAIKIEKLYKLNEMPYSMGAKAGQVLKLR